MEGRQKLNQRIQQSDSDDPEKLSRDIVLEKTFTNRSHDRFEDFFYAKNRNCYGTRSLDVNPDETTIIYNLKNEKQLSYHGFVIGDYVFINELLELYVVRHNKLENVKITNRENFITQFYEIMDTSDYRYDYKCVPTQIIQQLILTNQGLIFPDQSELEYDDKIQMLIKHGMSLNQLKAVDRSKLKNVVSVIDQLDNILKVVTLKQIFNMDHESPPLPENYKVVIPPLSVVENSEIFTEEIQFHFIRDEKEITMVSHEQSSYVIRSELLDEDDLEYYNELNSKKTSTRYLHHWFEVSVSDYKYKDHSIQHAYCSSDLRLIIFESYSESFPIDKFRHKYPNVKHLFPYFQEKYIEQELCKLGSSFEKLRILKGMTECKLCLLTHAMCIGITLLDERVAVNDLALVDEKRLSFLTEHHLAYISALKVVDGKEILGLNGTNTLTFRSSNNITYSPMLHAHNPSSNLINHEKDVSNNYGVQFKKH